MNLMVENEDGNMEFPRDMMLEDCFSPAEEPLFGFVTNVTIPEDMLEPCILNVECFENGTIINNTSVNDNEGLANLTVSTSNSVIRPITKKQGTMALITNINTNSFMIHDLISVNVYIPNLFRFDPRSI